MRKVFYSNGKLLLTGEYVVLVGSKALAIPTKFGQSLEVEAQVERVLSWESYDEKGSIWFKENFYLDRLEPANPSKIAGALSSILSEARKLNPRFLGNPQGYKVKTSLDFPRDWGLGSSSTLINNIAQWAHVNPFHLLERSFGGSGYDIAAAQNPSPLLYSWKKSENPKIEPVHLNWTFTSKLFFVYLNQKQDSSQEVARFGKLDIAKVQISEVSEISASLLDVPSLGEFEQLLNRHEQLISGIIKLPTIKERLFNDYPNTIKSLGAWGGDFILATGNDSDMEYFRKKGLYTIIPYDLMVL